MFESQDEYLDVDDEFLKNVFENGENNFVLDLKDKKTSNQSLEQCSIRNIEQNSTLSNFKTFSLPGPSVNECKPIRRQLNSPEKDSKEDPGNKENKRKHSSSLKPISTKRERKFPGPAGLLPDRKSCGVFPVKLDSLLGADNSHSSSTLDDLCSQGRCPGSILEEEPWQNFLADLGPDKSILKEVNVASVKRKAAAKCFVGRKVPFLAAVLYHLDVSSPDPCIILRDVTGEIHGTLHREVWELFAAELLVGSVLVIRNVGLLSTGISSRRHYLNITANNLVTIYAANTGTDKLKSAWLQTQDFAQSIHNWRSLVSPSFGIGSPASVGSPGLFNSTLCSPSSSKARRIIIPDGTNSKIQRKTEVNQVNLKNTPQSLHLNVKHNTGSFLRETAVGQDVMHSSLQGNCKNPLQLYSHNVSKQLYNSTPNQTRVFKNNCSEFTKTITTSFVEPLMKPNVKVSTEDTSFKFHPIILQPKTFGNSPQRSFEKQIRNSEYAEINTALHSSRTDSKVVNNSSKLILSQSTQLSIEEQSLVESVFDGVDGDSLFDDDF